MIPDSMDSLVQLGTSIALYSKLRVPGIIDSSFATALNLVDMTTNDYSFLQLLLRQVHPLLKIKNISVNNIRALRN